MTCLAANDLEITAYVLTTTNTNSNLGSLLSFIRNSFLRSSLSKIFVCFGLYPLVQFCKVVVMCFIVVSISTFQAI